MRRRNRLLWVALGFAGVLIGACALFATALFPPSVDAAAQLQAAEARWAAQGFIAYRMETRAGDCHQIGEFDGRHILSLKRQNCFDRIRTVERLFAMVERLEGWGLAAPRCAPSGCACREVRRVHVTYDEQRGYPKLIRLLPRRSIDWAYVFRTPSALERLGECTDPPPIVLMEVLSLEELTALSVER
jgi:hypothetical protein